MSLQTFYRLSHFAKRHLLVSLAMSSVAVPFVFAQPTLADTFTDNPTDNTIIETTTTRDVLFGGATSGASNFVFDVANVVADGRFGINLPAPTEALDVAGNISDILHQGQAFTVLSNMSVGSGNSPTGIAVSGKYAYVSNTIGDTFMVLDITSPASPAVVGTLSLGSGSGPSAVAVVGKYAYVSEESAGAVAVIDISNPVAPTVVTTLSGASAGIEISGHYLYSLTGDGFKVYDISNPASLSLVATVTVSGASNTLGLSISGNYAYVTDFDTDRLAIVDISNPAAPSVVTTLSLASGATPVGVVASPRYVYVGNQGNGTVDVVDVSNHASPTVVTSVSLGGGAAPARLALSGRYLYVTDLGNNRVSVLDVSNPASPVSIGTVPMGSGAIPTGIAVQGRYGYVANRNAHTISIFDIHGEEVNGLMAHSLEAGNLAVLGNGEIGNRLTVQGALEVGSGGILSGGALAVSAVDVTSTFLGPVTIQGKTVCLSDGTNCSSGLEPGATFTVVTSTYLGSGNRPSAVYVSGNYAYTVSGADNLLTILDITNISSPKIVTAMSLGAGTSPVAINVIGKYAYISEESANKVAVVDISNPASPSLVTTITGADDGLAISGHYLYSATFDGFAVFDITDPTSLSLVASTSLGASFTLAVDVTGNYLYVTDPGDDKVAVVDIRNPAVPVVVSTVSVASGAFPVFIATSPRYVYVSNQGNGTIDVIDVSNHASPTIVATVPLGSGSSPAQLALSGRYLYVTDLGLHRVSVLDVVNSASPVLINNVPMGSGASPVGIFVAGRYAFVANVGAHTVSIIDINGEEVNGLIAHSLQAGTLQVLGNGQIGKSLTVHGSLEVGSGGILSGGSVAAPGLSLTTSGTISGAGLTSCDGPDSRVTWNSTTQRFGCSTVGGNIAKNTSSTASVSLTPASTQIPLSTVTTTPRDTNSSVLVNFAVQANNTALAGRDITVQIWRGSSNTCAGTKVGNDMVAQVAAIGGRQVISGNFIDSPATTGATGYTVCAAASDATLTASTVTSRSITALQVRLGTD